MNQKGFSNTLAIILALVIIAGVAGYFMFFQKQNTIQKTTNISTSNSSQNTRIYQTKDEYRLVLNYPGHWSVTRRGNRIDFWSSASVIEGRNAPLSIKELEDAEYIASGTQGRANNFVILSISLVSGVQESLREYADYVIEYARQHPNIAKTTEHLSLKIIDFTKLSLPHTVSDDRLFISLGPSQIATVTIRFDSSSTSSNSIVSLKQEATEIVSSLKRY